MRIDRSYFNVCSYVVERLIVPVGKGNAFHRSGNENVELVMTNNDVVRSYMRDERETYCALSSSSYYSKYYLTSNTRAKMNTRRELAYVRSNYNR